MSKVVAGMAMSLDGHVADPNGSVARHYSDLNALRRADLLQEAIESARAMVM